MGSILTPEYLSARQHMTAAQIAKECGLSWKTVGNAARYHGVKIAHASRAQSWASDELEEYHGGRLGVVPPSLEEKVRRMNKVGHPPGVISTITGVSPHAVRRFLGEM